METHLIDARNVWATLKKTQCLSKKICNGFSIKSAINKQSFSNLFDSFLIAGSSGTLGWQVTAFGLDGDPSLRVCFPKTSKEKVSRLLLCRNSPYFFLKV